MKYVMAVLLLSVSGLAAADEYACKVYCKSGETYVSVKANSKEEAAAKVDKQGDQICRGDNRGNASDRTMRPEQCSRK